MSFSNDYFQILFAKNEKKKKNRYAWFKLAQTYSSTISFAYFEVFFLKIPTVKNFFPPGGGYFLPKGGLLPPYIQKLYIILLLRV